MTTTQPSVSIIIPAHNCAAFLSEAVKSVCAQTYTQWELLIIDDCSTDNTAQVMEDLAQTDTRIRTFHNEKNLGSAGTRNKGVTLASHDWIAFIDADDRWAQDKLARQVELLTQNPEAQFTFTGSAFMDAAGQKLNYTLHVPESVDFNTLMGQNIISCSSVLIARELLLAHPMPQDKSIHEDYAAWLMILETGIKAYGVDEPLLIYRVHTGSKSANKLKAAWMHWNCYRYVHSSFAGKIKGRIAYATKSVGKFSRL